jgi:short subunit dehydrogenase-like uncharacterized protein
MNDIKVVLNCAGPFSQTAEFVVQACLKARAHYVDITGEIPVFQALNEQYGAAAAAANIMLLPGAGFDIVPTDCMALHLKQKHPNAAYLRLAFGSNEPMSGIIVIL